MNVNFGRTLANATGSSGVGYTVVCATGSIVASRTTDGVRQLCSSSGVYAAYVMFPDEFRGSLLWDTGEAFPSVSYAVEDVNVEERNPRINDIARTLTGMQAMLSSLHDVSYGRWMIDKCSNRMLFYAPDNVTLVAAFDLFDDAGAPSCANVFERRKV